MVEANKLLIGTRKGLFILARNNGCWQQKQFAHAGAGVNYAARNPYTGDIWACLDHGHWGPKLSVSSDEGVTWRGVPVPTYPEGAQYLSSWDAHALAEARLFFIWTLAFMPDRILAGTEPGGLFESRDNGANFHLNEALWNHPSRLAEDSGWFGGGRGEGRGGAGIHSILLDKYQPELIRVGISCAGIFETTNGGKSWLPRNKGMTVDFMPDPEPEFGHDPHFVEACEEHPDVIWQQNHCGIFRSADGARNWSKISTKGVVPHFGFPVVADKEDSNTAWVIPGVADDQRMAAGGELRVFRTKDGGESWEKLERGLPEESAYDVVLRHAFSGHRGKLAFGSTTGNAFVSEDKGERWTCLGHYFPPIYSVRFA